MKEEVIKDNPTLKISSSKTSKKLPQFVGLDDMNKLLDKQDRVSGAIATKRRRERIQRTKRPMKRKHTLYVLGV